jgi:arginase family enzyme
VEAGTDTRWLHIDMDVLDPGVFGAVEGLKEAALLADIIARVFQA